MCSRCLKAGTEVSLELDSSLRIRVLELTTFLPFVTVPLSRRAFQGEALPALYSGTRLNLDVLRCLQSCWSFDVTQLNVARVCSRPPFSFDPVPASTDGRCLAEIDSVHLLLRSDPPDSSVQDSFVVSLARRQLVLPSLTPSSLL